MTTFQSQTPSVTIAKKQNKAQTLLLQFGVFLTIVGPFAITLYAAITLTHGKVHWTYPLATLLTFFFASLGTTAGYHRMLTHQAFQAHPAVQYFFLICGAIGGMGSPVTWAHMHLHHHSESDQEEDIHSPYNAHHDNKWLQWFHGHMGWMFHNQPYRVNKKARQVTDTPAAQFVHRTWIFWILAGLLIPLCFGWNAFIWIGGVRLFLNHHVTWSVNSICHIWGRQPFQETKDKSKNNAIVGILALGEGWHNNHHFRPRSARHGLLPGQIDLTYGVICLLERCKLVSAVQRYALCPECRDWHLTGTQRGAFVPACRKASP